MKKFVKRIAAFSFPVLISIIIMEILLRNIPNDYSYKRSYLDQKSKDIEVLILGSSHAYYGLDPRHLSLNSFNAAEVSQTLDYDYAIFSKYGNSLNRLKYIILPIDYFTFFTRLKNGAESWRIKNYEQYYDIHLSNSLNYNSEVLSNNLMINIDRINHYYINHEQNLTCSPLGWGASFKYGNHPNLIASGKSAAQRHQKVSDIDFNPNILTLEKLIKLADKQNIKVILYTSPAYKTYVENLSKKQLDQTFVAVKNIVAKNTNVSYYNWMTDDRFTSEDFYDADHLNDRGARKMTIKIDSLIKSVN